MKYQATITKNLKRLLWLSFCFSMISCFPVKVAPRIDGAKMFKGKKFSKQLPKQQVYVFEDPKNANEFYYYINAKFGMDYDEIGGNVPVSLSGKNHYLTFYEVERKTKVVNLVPTVVEVIIKSQEEDPILSEIQIQRSGTWYIALTVTDDDLSDNLKGEDPARSSIVAYLDGLRNEYLSTANYMDIYFRNTN